MGAQKERQ